MRIDSSLSRCFIPAREGRYRRFWSGRISSAPSQCAFGKRKNGRERQKEGSGRERVRGMKDRAAEKSGLTELLFTANDETENKMRRK